MKKVVLYIGVFIALIILTLWKLNANTKKNDAKTVKVRESLSAPVPVRVDTISFSKFDQHFSANGIFEPYEQIVLTSEIAGRVSELLVKDGDFVRQGQILARIDNEILRAALVASKAKLAQTKQDLIRYEQAFASGGVTQKQVDDIRLQVETAQAEYIQSNRNTDNALVKSPVSGVINERFFEIGAYQALGSKLFEIVNASRLKLTVQVTEFQVIHLNTGDKVKVTASVYPELYYPGTITYIAAKGDASLTYNVEIEIKNVSGKQPKAGMYGTAYFTPPSDGLSLLVPRSAFQGGVKSNTIFLAEGGKAKLHKVVAGRSLGNRVEVREGLKENDIVIISGQINLINGTPVFITE